VVREPSMSVIHMFLSSPKPIETQEHFFATLPRTTMYQQLVTF
jgi:hypothetical protein